MGMLAEVGLTTPSGQTPTVAGALQDDGSVEPGQHVGRYLIVAPLGQGGMGTVYRAYDPKLGREVALKVLRTRGTDASARLLREAHVMAQLSHPNVVPVYDVEQADENLFIAMELVRGTSLAAWLRERPRPWRDVLAKFCEAGRGLAAAHAAGIIHRDFKPTNVMIGEDGRTRVLDFGLARSGDEPVVLESPSGDELTPRTPPHVTLTTPLTQMGMVMGTPAYMAPEHHQGDELDARGDVYSFSVALFEGLYGARPFIATKTGLYEAKVNFELVTVSTEREVPGWVREIVLRGLAPDRGARWPEIESMLAALARDPARRRRMWLAGGAAAAIVAGVVGGIRFDRARTHAACASDGETISEQWDAQRAASIEGAFAKTGLGYASGTWTRVEQRLGEYAAQWASLRTQACVETHLEAVRTADSLERASECFEGLRQQLAALVAQLEQPNESIVQWAVSSAASLPSPRECLDGATLAHRPRAPTEASRREAVAGLRVRLAQGSALEWTGQYQPAANLYAEILSDAEEVGWSPLVAAALLRVGVTEDQLGNYDRANEALQRAFATGSVSGHDEVAVRSASALMVNAVHMGDHEQPLHWHWLGSITVERAGFRSDHPAVLELLRRLATARLDQGSYDEAQLRFREVVDRYTETLGPEHPRVARARLGVARALSGADQVDAAVAEYREARTIMAASLGPEHPEVAKAGISIANTLNKVGRHEEALAEQRDALVVLKQALGADHPRLAVIHNNMGNSLKYLDRIDDAAFELRTALRLSTKGLGPKHSDTGLAHHNLGTLLIEHGSVSEGLEELRAAEAIAVESFPPGHPRFGLLHIGIGSGLRKQGDMKGALVQYRKAVSALTSALGPGHRHVAVAQFNVGSVLRLLGRPNEAVPVLEAAGEIMRKVSKTGVWLAHIEFELGQALWETNEQGRAVRLVAGAVAAYERAEAEELEEARAWVAAHPLR